MTLTRSVGVRALETDCNVEDVVDRDLEIQLESPLERSEGQRAFGRGLARLGTRGNERRLFLCHGPAMKVVKRIIFQVDRAVEEGRWLREP